MSPEAAASFTHHLQQRGHKRLQHALPSLRSLPFVFCHSKQTTAWSCLSLRLFSLKEVTQTKPKSHLLLQPLSAEFISIYITNTKPLRAHFANRTAHCFSSLLISKMLINTRRARGCYSEECAAASRSRALSISLDASVFF